MLERAVDRCDPAGGNTRISRRCVQLVVAENGLDVADIGTLLEQLGCEGVAVMPSSA